MLKVWRRTAKQRVHQYVPGADQREQLLTGAAV
jgi:hypothetical protein